MPSSFVSVILSETRKWTCFANIILNGDVYFSGNRFDERLRHSMWKMIRKMTVSEQCDETDPIFQVDHAAFDTHTRVNISKTKEINLNANQRPLSAVKVNDRIAEETSKFQDDFQENQRSILRIRTTEWPKLIKRTDTNPVFSSFHFDSAGFPRDHSSRSVNGMQMLAG